MARPERHNADYFPFYAKDGRTLFLLESKYQCKGTGFFTNLMRFLTLETDHYCNLSEETDKWYFFSKCHCDEESGIDMLNIMAKTGKINKELWDKKIIVSQDLLNSLEDAYRNRKNCIITIPEIIEKEVSNVRNGVNDVRNGVNDVENTQRKGKETKGKETKRNNYLSDSIEYRLSEFLLEKIKENNPQYKEPNLQTWSKYIGLMIRNDNRAPDDIRLLIEFCQSDNFWKVNILSTQKLREKFDQLWIKMKSSKENKNGKQSENFSSKKYTGSDLDSIPWNK